MDAVVPQWVVYLLFTVTLTTILILAVRSHRIKRVLGVPWYSLLISADIAGQRPSKPLKKDGLIGSPDGVFFDPIHWRWLICEFKSRRFSNSYTLRERYQLQLYLGMSRRWYCPRVEGRMVYRGGSFIVPFEPQTYEALLSLLPEAVAVTKSWKLLDPRPLHKRIELSRVKYKRV